MNTNKDIILIIKRFIEDAGNMTQSFGLGRVVGQLYAYLYFSSMPKNLADMQEALGISKGSASTAKGDRKDYYEACDWFGRILRNAIVDTFGKRMASYASLIDDIEVGLAEVESGGNDEGEFIKGQIESLKKFQKKAFGILENPIVQAIVK